MKIIIEKNIGKSKLSVEVEGEKDIDALVKASTITSMPDHCTLCKSDQGVELVANKAESFTFIKVRCQNPKCRATSTMGQYKDNSGGFWKLWAALLEERNYSKTQERLTIDVLNKVSNLLSTIHDSEKASYDLVDDVKSLVAETKTLVDIRTSELITLLRNKQNGKEN